MLLNAAFKKDVNLKTNRTFETSRLFLWEELPLHRGVQFLIQVIQLLLLGELQEDLQKRMNEERNERRTILPSTSANDAKICVFFLRFACSDFLLGCDVYAFMPTWMLGCACVQGSLTVWSRCLLQLLSTLY